MRLGLDQQTIIVHILLKISCNKDNQAMKSDELIEYNKRNIFHQKSCRKWDRETSSRTLCVLKKPLYKVRRSGLWLVCTIFR